MRRKHAAHPRGLIVALLALVASGSARAQALSLPYSEGFESGLDGWTSTTTYGLCSWRVIDHPEKMRVSGALNPFLLSLPNAGFHLAAAGGTHVVWFGEESTGTYVGSDYNPALQTAKHGGYSASRQMGSLISPSISLLGVSHALLEFDSWWELEGAQAVNYDKLQVYVSIDNGANYDLQNKLNPAYASGAPSSTGYTSGGSSTPPAWRHYAYDLTNYVGNEVVIMFTFDTTDQNYNAFRGWTLDNISVTGSASLPGPTVTAVSPSIGTASSSIGITGTNFYENASVYIGTTKLSSSYVTVFGTGAILFKVPAAGFVDGTTYDIKVVNPDTQSSTLPLSFTYTDTFAPYVSSLFPTSGAIGLTQSVSLSGSSFVVDPATTVTVGGQSATDVTVIDENNITATFPALTVGYYNVVVTSPSGQRGTRYGAYSVFDSSTLAVSSPNGGESLGIGSATDITWVSADANTVDIVLLKGGSWAADVATAVSAATGTYHWTIPGVLAAGSDYTIRIDVTGGTTTDTSDAAFSLTSGSASTTTLTSTANPSSYGQSVTFTATVSPDTATGTVQFAIDGSNQGSPVALIGGIATLTLSSLSVGTHTVLATYSGGGGALGSSDTLSQVVSKSSSVTTLDSTPNPSIYGQMITFNATVTLPSELLATGQVAFYMDATLIGTATLDENGKATLMVIGMPSGSKSMTAIYQGDANCETSTSTVLTQVVNKASTTTALVSDNNPSLFGQSVKFTATVSAVAPGGGTPSGSVAFLDGLDTLAVVALSGGSASYTTSALSSGTHDITAVYGGGTNHSSSSSNQLSQTVQPACVIASTVYAAGTENPANPCQVCTPSSNPTDWSNRPSGFDCPADALSCTSDICDGAGSCTHPLATGCLISGACIATSASSPSNECQECNPALSTTAYSPKARGVACTNDGSDLTDDYCDGASVCIHPVKTICVIDTVTYQSGTANPVNSCQVCDSVASTSSWTNRVDGYPCTSDDLSCTWDACDNAGVCRHTTYSGCLIDNQCIVGGATAPSNECQECNPALSNSAYSPKAEGVACADDDNPNTLDVCDGTSSCIHPLRGQCTIDGLFYDSGTTNPSNACESCDPATSVSTWTSRPSGYPCTTDGLACTADVCDGTASCQHVLFTGCLIDGACVGATADDPQNECAECNPAVSTTAYSPKARGIACSDDGSANTLDICDGSGTCAHPLTGQCLISEQLFNSGAGNPSNSCQSCDPSASATDWTNRVGGYPCASDELACTADTCDGQGVCTHTLFTGCLIDGACVAAGGTNASQECTACDPSQSTTTYSDKPKGVGCTDDGVANTLDVCDGAGACSHPLSGQCLIANQLFNSGAANPSNPCEACSPELTALAWSARTDGFPCTTDGLSCTSDVCDGQGTCTHVRFTGCLIGGACVAAGAIDPSGVCRECNPAVATEAYSSRAQGVSCTDDGQENTADICDGAGVCTHPVKGQCFIDGKSYSSGTANPENPCLACDARESISRWTSRVSGFPCATDGLSCTSDTCDGSGTCLHTRFAGCLIADACVPQGAADPSSDCRTCDPIQSTSQYSLKPASVDCAGACGSTSDCAIDHYCLAGVCRPNLAEGVACTESRQCASGVCSSETCRGLTMGGGWSCSSAGAEMTWLAALALSALVRRRRERR